MKVLEAIADFPAKPPKLEGITLEAFNLLAQDHKNKVMVIDPEGSNVPALKRAFHRAAKVHKLTVKVANDEHGHVLVGVVSTAPVRKARTRTTAAAATPHNPEAVEAEAKRLWTNGAEARGQTPAVAAKGWEKLDEALKRKYRISAKRNLSRKA